MNFEQLRQSLAGERAPRGLTPPVRALWHEARGDWQRAHEIVAAERSRDAARVHAYLHRKEGDTANADYWYGRARDERPRGSLQKEWEMLARLLLEREV